MPRPYSLIQKMQSRVNKHYILKPEAWWRYYEDTTVVYKTATHGITIEIRAGKVSSKVFISMSNSDGVEWAVLKNAKNTVVVSRVSTGTASLGNAMNVILSDFEHGDEDTSSFRIIMGVRQYG